MDAPTIADGTKVHTTLRPRERWCRWADDVEPTETRWCAHLVGLVVDLCTLSMHERLLFSTVKICGGFSVAPNPKHTVLIVLRNQESYLGSIEEALIADTVVASQILSEGERFVSLLEWHNLFSAMKIQCGQQENGEERMAFDCEACLQDMKIRREIRLIDGGSRN